MPPLFQNKADELLARLKQISVTSLDKEEKINYNILNDLLSTFISGYKWRELVLKGDHYNSR